MGLYKEQVSAEVIENLKNSVLSGGLAPEKAYGTAIHNIGSVFDRAPEYATQARNALWEILSSQSKDIPEGAKHLAKRYYESNPWQPKPSFEPGAEPA